MSLLGDGLSTDEVAKRLFLSPTTVRVHISSVIRKLRVKDRQSAIELLREDRS
jgi:DNA-binding NarL/FixJ family response regulator